MKRYIVGLFVMLVSIGCCASDGLDYVAAKRKVKDQLAHEYLQCIELDGENAKLAKPVNEEMRRLLESLPNNTTKTTGELMNPEQADKFGRLGQKQQFFTGKSLFISKRDRDVEFVRDMFEVIIADFEQVKMNFRSDRNEEQRKFINSLADWLGSKVMEEEETLTKMERVNDGVDGALVEVVRCIGDIIKARGDKILMFQEAIEKRNGKKFKSEDLVGKEKDEYQEIREPVKLAWKANLRLMGLMTLYSLMTMESKWSMEEFSSSAGDLNSAGKRMNEFGKKAGKDVQLMAGMVRVINDKFPCRWVRDMEMMNKAVNNGGSK